MTVAFKLAEGLALPSYIFLAFSNVPVGLGEMCFEHFAVHVHTPEES
jgi:hypothetical protein